MLKRNNFVNCINQKLMILIKYERAETSICTYPIFNKLQDLKSIQRLQPANLYE